VKQHDRQIVKVERSNLESDLGIIIDVGLTFFEYIHMAAKKAS